MVRATSGIDRLIDILAALRAPETGCPWDREQTHASLAPYAIEEAYELADAIDGGDASDIRDELGDCLLQVVFHARVAEEAGAFAFADVVEAVCAKMLRRHPHIFPPASAASAADGEPDAAADRRRPDWEGIKALERAARRRGGGLLDDVPGALPALTRAVKLQGRAATVGFDWDDPRLILAKIREEVGEVEAEMGGDVAALEGEIGDLLFAVCNLARRTGIDPEAALRSGNRKFARRFGFIEQSLASLGRSMRDADLAEMEALWNEAKRLERSQDTSPTTAGGG